MSVCVGVGGWVGGYVLHAVVVTRLTEMERDGERAQRARAGRGGDGGHMLSIRLRTNQTWVVALATSALETCLVRTVERLLASSLMRLSMA